MTTSPKSSVSPVAIIGAGPGGLLLARYLQIHSVPCVIYERETSASARGQGGSLDLHGDTGLEALRRTELLDEARGLMRPEGDVLKIMDKTGKVLWDENKEGGVRATDTDSTIGRPEIDRSVQTGYICFPPVKWAGFWWS
jgi:2-polyprenyl-6-methoxyphenol hydroxylase-like FAD-dependent oxidoreductase